MFSSLPFCPHNTTVHLQHRESRSKKDQLSCCKNSTPRKQVDEKCSFKRRYSPRWHFYSPWSNVLRELSLEAAHQLSLQLLKTPNQRKLINRTLKAQSYHQVGRCSFRCSVWGWRMTMLSNVRCLFSLKDLWIVFFFKVHPPCFNVLWPIRAHNTFSSNQFIQTTGEN